jgi:hypothetical protein
MINFNHHFLSGTARTLQPLTAAQAGNPKVLNWLQIMFTSFAATEVALVAAIPLAQPLPGAVLSLTTDASDTHVGAFLQQHVDQQWLPLGFYSKKPL